MIRWSIPLFATIAKEPKYQSKPKYCLLVFGPEAKTRVWLVLDGDVLYVDRNGNGDLTEEGERIEFGKGQTSNAPDSPIGELRDLPPISVVGSTRLTAMQFLLKKDFVPKTKEQKELTARLEKSGVILIAYIGGKVRQHAAPIFADSLVEAPIIHFNGPLTLQPLSLPGPVLTRGETPSELRISLASTGFGEETFAFLDYDEVPKHLHPVAEIEFPRKNPDEKGDSDQGRVRSALLRLLVSRPRAGPRRSRQRQGQSYAVVRQLEGRPRSSGYV
jgi:hypothetical protein